MADLVTPDQLADAIVDAVTVYTDGVEEAIPQVVKRNVDEARADLASSSPNLTGSYAAGWSVRKLPVRGGGAVRYVIHNKTDYQIAHLLEFGHAKRNGGRVSGIPHIAPVAEAHGAKLSDDLARLVVSGGAR